MKISKELTDESILAEIGKRIARRRLDLQLTQAVVAEQAGIAKRTLERMEAGHSSQLSSLIRVLRVLDAMPGLEALVPEASPRPMELLKRKGRQRQRASRPRVGQGPPDPWQWKDDP
ncbi:MAG: helix-turn-helix transcriptional regulator [Halioglobus sp.]|nr:helix-turn-helix transcriptional regulator [Halioglobus sp.]